MASMVVLLRGINIGSSNRIAMPALRDALSDAGFENPRTYVQSGNIVLETDLGGSVLADRVENLIAEAFSLKVSAVAISDLDLARVVAGNPFPELAEAQPRRFQVSFLRGDIEAGAVTERLNALATGDERVAVGAREVYAWHPDGVARSKLALKLGARDGLGRGVIATSRNWTTVLMMLRMASGDG